MIRPAILNKYLGKPWQANAKGPDSYDCWHLAQAVSRDVFGRDLPAIYVPENPSWGWLIDTIAKHPERERWRECPPAGLVTAADGALVLMARLTRPAHIGVWLAPERRIIHADARFGVVCESPLDLHMSGWTKLRFYEPFSVIVDSSQ